jgi:hypothetical protein
MRPVHALAIGNHESLGFTAIAGAYSAGRRRSVRQFRILAGLTLAAVLPVAAHTFGLVTGIAPQACLTLGNTTYRLAGGNADVAVRIDPAAPAPGLRIEVAKTPEEADFVLVDDGAVPDCRSTGNAKTVRLTATADFTVQMTDGTAPADYRIYVRSRWITPETAAVLFAAAHMPSRKWLAANDRSN